MSLYTTVITRQNPITAERERIEFISDKATGDRIFLFIVLAFPQSANIISITREKLNE